MEDALREETSSRATDRLQMSLWCGTVSGSSALATERVMDEAQLKSVASYHGNRCPEEDHSKVLRPLEALPVDQEGSAFHLRKHAPLRLGALSGRSRRHPEQNKLRQEEGGTGKPQCVPSKTRFACPGCD